MATATTPAAKADIQGCRQHLYRIPDRGFLSGLLIRQWNQPARGGPMSWMRPLLCIALLALGLISFGPGPARGAAPSETEKANLRKTKLLEEKLAAMEALRGQIGIRLIEASTIRNSLANRIGPLELEVQALCSEYNLTAFAQTPAYPEVHFSLKSLAYLQGYQDAIRDVMARFREVDHALQYLHRQVQDDLEVIATLKDFTIDALVNRIDKTLDFPDAHYAYLIDAAQVRTPAAETIFNRIVAVARTES